MKKTILLFQFIFLIVVNSTNVFAQDSDGVIRIDEIVIQVAPIEPSVVLYQERKEADFNLLEVKASDFLQKAGEIEVDLFLPKKRELSAKKISNSDIEHMSKKIRN